jgi:hypothetical protein
MPGDALLLWWSANQPRIQKLLKPEGFFRRMFGSV